MAMEKLVSLDLSDIQFLVVDDNEFVRRLVFEILVSFGARYVQQATSAEEALAAMKRREPDLIITDWVMPGLTGLDLLRSLRGGGGATRIPVIVLSGHATSDYVSQALGEGADSYIVKPFSPQTVMDHLLKVIAHSDKATAYV
jgi:two-component system chemotaxis response regulator CheY